MGQGVAGSVVLTPWGRSAVPAKGQRCQWPLWPIWPLANGQCAAAGSADCPGQRWLGGCGCCTAAGPPGSAAPLAHARRQGRLLAPLPFGQWPMQAKRLAGRAGRDTAVFLSRWVSAIAIGPGPHQQPLPQGRTDDPFGPLFCDFHVLNFYKVVIF